MKNKAILYFTVFAFVLGFFIFRGISANEHVYDVGIGDRSLDTVGGMTDIYESLGVDLLGMPEDTETAGWEPTSGEANINIGANSQVIDPITGETTPGVGVVTRPDATSDSGVETGPTTLHYAIRDYSQPVRDPAPRYIQPPVRGQRVPLPPEPLPYFDDEYFDDLTVTGIADANVVDVKGTGGVPGSTSQTTELEGKENVEIDPGSSVTDPVFGKKTTREEITDNVGLEGVLATGSLYIVFTIPEPDPADFGRDATGALKEILSVEPVGTFRIPLIEQNEASSKGGIPFRKELNF